MQKTNGLRFSILALIIAVVAGCSSVPMPKGNSKGYSSVRFINEKKSAEFQESDRSKEVNQVLQQAITEQFEAKGMDVLEQDADLIIAYLIIVQDKVATTTIDKHFGYRDTSEAIGKIHEKGIGGRDPEYVKKGALVIDLIDAKTMKLVYRNYATRGAGENLTGEALRTRLDEVTQEILTSFFK